MKRKFRFFPEIVQVSLEYGEAPEDIVPVLCDAARIARANGLRALLVVSGLGDPATADAVSSALDEIHALGAPPRSGSRSSPTRFRNTACITSPSTTRKSSASSRRCSSRVRDAKDWLGLREDLRDAIWKPGGSHASQRLSSLPDRAHAAIAGRNEAMRLAQFITENLEQLLVEWEAFALSLLRPGQEMTSLALRDHATQILLAIAEDIESNQTDLEQAYKSKGFVPIAEATRTAAMTHGALRYLAGFDLRQLAAEFRALRASVLRLWLKQRRRRRDGVLPDDALQRGDRPGARRVDRQLLRRGGALARHVPRDPGTRPAQPALRDRQFEPVSSARPACCRAARRWTRRGASTAAPRR